MSKPIGWKTSTIIVLALLTFIGLGVAGSLAEDTVSTNTEAQYRAELTPEMVAAEKRLEERKQARLAEEQKEWEASKAGQICTAHPGWDKETCEIIAEKKVKLGMDQAQALASWGKPDDINTTVTSRGKREQWVYGYSNYLYFENGILTSFQN